MCKEKYISPFTDFGFKRLFGSEANKEFLISFLNSLIDDPDKIVDISYENVEKFGMSADERKAVFDLYCTTESGAHIIVEMQNAYQRYFMDRTIYYSSFPMQEVAKSGAWDFRLPKIYTIAILNFNMSEYHDTPECKHVAKLTDVGTGKVFYDKLTYIYLEMPKFNKEIDQLESDYDRWMYVIKNMNNLEEYPERLKEKIFKAFFKKAEIYAFTRDERIAYELSLKAYRDYNNTISSAEWLGEKKGLEKGLEKGREEGREEGLKEGEAIGVEKGKIEIAKKMLLRGMSAEDVAEMTGIDPSLL